jgi:Tfp pilus assembly protein PilX
MRTYSLQGRGRAFRQRGYGTLVVAMLLLLGGTILAFFANRSFIFEQRTSANQYRATKAFELAEAGVDWAIGRLNDGMAVSTATADSCDAVVGGASATFRGRYVSPQSPDATHPNPWFDVPASGASPSCRFDPTSATNGGWTCLCPTGTTVAVLGTQDQGRFGVRFNRIADSSAVEIVSRGCSNLAAATDTCDPVSSAQPTGDATAVVRVLVKLRPYITSGPAAALTSGSATTASGNLNVINYFTPSNGITIHAGTTVETGSGTNVYTLPGTPARSSILDNDPTLADTTMLSDDQFFSRFFSESLDSYRARVVNISNCGGNCAARVMTEIDRGREPLQLYVDGNMQFTSANVGTSTTGTIGSSNRPVTLVYTGTLDMQGSVVGHGIFYAATPTATAVANPGGGTATIYGAFVSRGSFQKQGAGTFNIIYTPTLWSSGKPNGLLLRVPGSWRDKLGEY